MKVDYEVRKLNNGEILQLIMKTVDLTENVSVSQTIYKEDFIKAGNIIDKTTLPFKLCYILLKKFQEKTCRLKVKVLLKKKQTSKILKNYSRVCSVLKTIPFNLQKDSKIFNSSSINFCNLGCEVTISSDFAI